VIVWFFRRMAGQPHAEAERGAAVSTTRKPVQPLANSSRTEAAALLSMIVVAHSDMLEESELSQGMTLDKWREVYHFSPGCIALSLLTLACLQLRLTVTYGYISRSCRLLSPGANLLESAIASLVRGSCLTYSSARLNFSLCVRDSLEMAGLTRTPESSNGRLGPVDTLPRYYPLPYSATKVEASE
jgi:hypothetical protein